jgi:hypothetical protein
MDLIQSIATSISAYIDMHEKTELTKTQKQAVLEAREVILKSLEIVQSGEKIGPKKMKKVEGRLDAVFNNVISVFAETKADTPEILETKMQAREKAKEDKEVKKSNQKKEQSVAKSKKEKTKTKKAKVDQKQTPTDIDFNGFEEILKIIQKVDGNVNILKEQVDTQNIAMIAAMTIMEDLAKKVQKLEKKVEELEK